MDVRSQRRGVLPRMQKGSQQVVDGAATKPGRIIVNLDVLELGPIELEVRAVTNDICLATDTCGHDCLAYCTVHLRGQHVVKRSEG